MALETLRSNKLRSTLTILGVVIGITSIVGMTSLLAGSTNRCATASARIGPNTIFIAKVSGVSLAAGGDFATLFRRPNLTVADAKAIESWRHRSTSWTRGSATRLDGGADLVPR
jgi:putative ABC transport system permease protein